MEKIIRWRMLLMVAALVIVLGLIGVSQGIAQQRDSGKGGAEKGGTNNDSQQQPVPAPAPATLAEQSVAVTAVAQPANVSYAFVKSDGTLNMDRSLGALSAKKINTGMYEVKFDHDVSKCAYVGTIGLDDSSTIPTGGEISTNGRKDVAGGVWVSTFNSSGSFKDRGFYLQVACVPPPPQP